MRNIKVDHVRYLRNLAARELSKEVENPNTIGPEVIKEIELIKDTIVALTIEEYMILNEVDPWLETKGIDDLDDIDEPLEPIVYVDNKPLGTSNRIYRG